MPACTERGPQILNICELYEQGPVVLALFVDGGSCPDVLGDMQALRASFPGVRFAAVAIKGDTAGVRKLIRSRGLTFPVGLDRDGALAALYKVATCPQVTFVEPGGVVQSKALLTRPSPAALRARVAALAAAGRPARERWGRVSAGRLGSSPPAAGARREVAEELPGLQLLYDEVQVARAGPLTGDSPPDIERGCANSPTAFAAPARSASAASRCPPPTACSSATSASTPTSSARRSRRRCSSGCCAAAFSPAACSRTSC